MTEKETKERKLIPPDPQRCQAEKMPPYSFMSLGPPHRVRCTNEPVALVAETVCDDQGLCGSMTLCAECLEVFKKQVGFVRHIVATIERPAPAHRKG